MIVLEKLMTNFKDIDGNCLTPDQETKEFVLNHTMLRVKDPKKSLDFYTRVMGMRLVRKNDFPGGKFSLYFSKIQSFYQKMLGVVFQTIHK